MAFKKTFTVSTEDLNSFGFYTNTSGIDLSYAQKNCPAFINHDYWDLPIGHWENLRKEGNTLLADLIIDGTGQRENEVIQKIENGDLRGASIGADPQEWNTDISQFKDGQTAPTLAKSSLFEISVTPLPSNQSALCLKKDGQPIKLTATNINNIIPQIKTKTDMKKIALMLGLSENATETEIADAIGKIQLSAQKSESLTKLTQDILDKAAEGLEDKQKEIFVTLSKTNAKQAIAYAESQKTIVPETTETKTETTKFKKDVKVSDLIRSKKSEGAASEDGKDSFDYLSKHDIAELARIKRDEPEKYTQLTREYAKGVRYTGKTA